MALVIQNLHKSFDGYVALDRINLSIENAEFVCLLGPSGCGKTTLLRIIAGLLSCDGGKSRWTIAIWLTYRQGKEASASSFSPTHFSPT